jgi:hypothetical protein
VAHVRVRVQVRRERDHFDRRGCAVPECGQRRDGRGVRLQRRSRRQVQDYAGRAILWLDGESVR